MITWYDDPYSGVMTFSWPIKDLLLRAATAHRLPFLLFESYLMSCRPGCNRKMALIKVLSCFEIRWMHVVKRCGLFLYHRLRFRSFKFPSSSHKSLNPDMVALSVLRYVRNLLTFSFHSWAFLCWPVRNWLSISCSVFVSYLHQYDFKIAGLLKAG